MNLPRRGDAGMSLRVEGCSIQAAQGSHGQNGKEMYTDLMNKKAKIEEQMMEVSHSLNFDDDNFLLPLKGMYTDLMNKKAKIEEQMMEVSHSLCAMEVLMEKLKSSVEETNEAESICSNGVEHLVSSSPCFPGNYRGC
ncbi:hypothetical protein Pint_03782 [Pistacia integerrima]|uniref:Uncharacterized protein n=1 Tax=Pistacia integerrima TaxID=434235 RepID=A0ACC0Z912_9ROSI|nr:hypothetical protein Pint_03782 [Pistacia integerrima]